MARVHTVNFSTMGAVPWNGDPSNVNIEVSRCGGELLRSVKIHPKESVRIRTRDPRDLSQTSGSRNLQTAWLWR